MTESGENKQIQFTGGPEGKIQQIKEMRAKVMEQYGRLVQLEKARNWQMLAESQKPIEFQDAGLMSFWIEDIETLGEMMEKFDDILIDSWEAEDHFRKLSDFLVTYNQTEETIRQISEHVKKEDTPKSSE